MSHSSQQTEMGHMPFSFFEIKAPSCGNIYGASVTNAFPNSNAFGNTSVWQHTLCSVVQASTIEDPTLGFSPFEIIASTAAVQARVSAPVSALGHNNALSIFAKKNTNGHLQFTYYVSGTVDRTEVWLDLNEGVIASSRVFSAGPELKSTNVKEYCERWHRYEMVFSTTVSTANTKGVRIALASAVGAVGVGTSSASEYVFGFQAESNASSVGHYVFTSGGAAVLSCNASLTGDNKCRNTYITCQDKSNYSKVCKTYRHCENRANLPLNINMIPDITRPAKDTTMKFDPGKTLGSRGVITIGLKDFPHDDVGVDPYVNERSTSALDRGTYWTRWLASNPYYIGKTIIHYKGYLEDGHFDWDNFNKRYHIIESISHPDSRGNLAIKSYDFLRNIEDDRAQIPPPSKGVLASALSSTATDVKITPASSIFAEYGSANGVVRIGKELIHFASAYSSTEEGFRGCTRGYDNTGIFIKNHNSSSTVQTCYVLSSVNVVDFITSALVDYGNVPRNFIPTTDWNTERDLWLSASKLTTILHKPTGINKILNELCELCMFNVWWEDHDREFKLKALSPQHLNATIPTFDDTDFIIKNSVKVTYDDKERISQVWVYYNKNIRTEDDGKPENYDSLYIATDLASEGVDEFGVSRVKIIFSSWWNTQTLSALLGGRLIARYRDGVNKIELKAYDKDGTVHLGDTITLNVDAIRDANGNIEDHNTQVVGIAEDSKENTFKMDAVSLAFYGTYGFIASAEASTTDYGSATTAERQRWAFIASSGTAQFANGDPAYKII